MGGILKKTTTERLVKLLKIIKGTSDLVGDNEVEESEIGDGMTMRDAEDFANIDDIDLDKNPEGEEEEQIKQEDNLNSDSPSELNFQNANDEIQEDSK